MIHPEDQGSPGWPATPIWRDDGGMEEQAGWPRFRNRRHGLLRRRGPRGTGPLRRRQSDRLAGGVAAGLASRLGFDVNVVRIAFVVATVFTGGTFAVGYVLAWLLVPADGADGNLASRALTDGRGLAVAAGIGSLTFIAWVIVSVLHAGWLGNLAWPLGLCVAGIVLIWRNAPADEQAAMRQLAEPLLSVTAGQGRSRIVLRVLLAPGHRQHRLGQLPHRRLLVRWGVSPDQHDAGDAQAERPDQVAEPPGVQHADDDPRDERQRPDPGGDR